MKERRKYRRHEVNNNVFVFSSALPGRITDLSLGGMAFSHVVSDESLNPDDDSLSILDSDHEFFLGKINYRNVKHQVKSSNFPASYLQTAERSVEFILSPSQKAQLQAYLQTQNNNTTS